VAQILDACGLTCPAPVLLVKDAVERQAPTEITVKVDNEPSSENVTRFLQTHGYVVTAAEEAGTYTLRACRQEGATPMASQTMTESPGEGATRKVLILIASDRLGSGDDSLGQRLMVNYLKTIKEMGDDLWQLIFVNGGVRLTTSDSPVLAELQDYERAGLTILACGTCLEHFGLTGAKAVGATTNMLDIVTATQVADKVVTMS